MPFGVAQAATIRVGYFYGARDAAAVTRAGWTAMAIGTSFMVLTASAMIVAPMLLVRIYVDPDAARNAAMVGFAVQYMMVAAAFALFDGVQAVAAGALRGLQDTRTPMRAGVVALVANMLFNIGLLALLYAWKVPPEARAGGIMAGLASTPGLHFALGIASALSSYLNLGLLLYWLRKARVYDPMPGWGRFLLRLGIANAAMAAAVGYGLWLAPGFTTMGAWSRVWWLAGLVGGGALAYALAMLALGFRLRDLREH